MWNRQEGNDPGRLGKPSNMAQHCLEWPKGPDRDHVGRDRSGRHGVVRGYGPAVVSGIGAGRCKAWRPKGSVLLSSSHRGVKQEDV